MLLIQVIFLGTGQILLKGFQTPPPLMETGLQ